MPVRLEIKVSKASSADEQQKNLEKALKVFKNKVFKIGIVKELRDRTEYLKPSVRKRLQKEKAIKKNKYLNNF
jgi:small subunit ribosomal protein S21